MWYFFSSSKLSSIFGTWLKKKPMWASLKQGEKKCIPIMHLFLIQSLLHHAYLKSFKISNIFMFELPYSPQLSMKMYILKKSSAY